MSDQPPQKKRSLTEISHLFLSSIRDRQNDGSQRPQRTPPPSDQSIDLTPEEFASVYGGGDQPPATPERKPVPIHASVLGSMVGRNLTLLGSVNANADDWRTAVGDLQAMRGRYPGVVEELVTHRFGMGDAEVAFERVPGQIKAIISIA